MSKISVFTPTHNTKHLKEAYDSLLAQTHQDWEWIVLPNAEANVDPAIYSDPRVRIVDHFYLLQDAQIGVLKHKACDLSSGEILLEFDHDDVLTPWALADIDAAFSDPEVDFVYGNFAEFKDGDRSPHVFRSDCGWIYRPTKVGDVMYQEAVAPPPEPPYITDITHAPNHPRAWRASFYKEVGGHGCRLDVGDDFDLVVRTYLSARKIVRIQKLLYLYRFYDDNTYKAKINRIRAVTANVYRRYAFDIMLRFCRDRNLKPIDLGSAHNKPQNFLGCDKREAPGVDYVFDLEGPWPFDDDSVGVIRCHDVLEHLPTEKKIHFFNEAWRVLAPSGALMIEVPSFNGAGSVMDPTHRSFWLVNSFWYHTTNNYQAFNLPEAFHAFAPRELFEYFPSDWHKENNISYVRAHLFAVKEYGHSHPMWVPSMFPPKGFKPRPAGTITYPASGDQPQPPAVVVASHSSPWPEEDGAYDVRYFESLVGLPMDRVVMKADHSTEFSYVMTSTIIIAAANAFKEDRSALPFKTPHHEATSLSVVYGGDGKVESLNAHFEPTR